MRRGTRALLPTLVGFLVAAVGLPLSAPAPAAAQGSTSLVISQVYGGGGNAGALYTHDFIELFNRSESPASLSGWSVQYAATTGTTWQVTNLSGTLQPGQYYLVEQSAGANPGTALPTPDATGSISMAAGNGKVALVSSTTALSGACPTEGVIDFVGYGTANCFEGSAAAPALTNSTSALRLESGCQDTDHNAADFVTANPPTPRNTASPLNLCGDEPPPPPPVVAFAAWDFEGNTTAPSIDLTGNAAAAAGSGLAGVGFVTGSTLPGGTPGAAWTASSWALASAGAPDATKYFEFKVDLSSYENVALSFAERRSGTGPLNYVIRYSTDGSTFSDVPGTTTNIPNDTNFHPNSFDFSALNEQIAGQASVQFRILGYNASAAGGTWRIDDVIFTGTEGDGPTNPSGVGAADPSTVEAGEDTLLTVAVTPGARPTSTDISVTGDLTAIGGSATQPFFDDGSSGDATAGDNTFSFMATVDPATAAGSKSLPITITDGEGRTANTSIALSVVVIEQCGDDFTPIYDIQGDGNVTPFLNQTVSTEGVVIGAYEGPSPALRGLYIQDPVGDDDPTTSDGIFVFTANDVSGAAVGDLIRVGGRATEFQDQTQIDFVGSLVFCDSDLAVNPTDVTLPFPAPVGGVHYLERFEGMLVNLPQTLYVTEHFQLGRFGQVVMSSGDRLFQPTNVVLPGAPAAAMQTANDLSRIIIDDDVQSQNPDPIIFGRGGDPLSAENTLRGGDTATGIVGVMTYTWAGNAASGNAFRVRPATAMGGGVPDFQPTNPRPAAAPEVGGTLRVSNFNVLNYFNTFGNNCAGGVGGAPMDCRGADNATEFQRQTAKIVEAIVGLDADVVGLMEIENDGYGPTSAISELVDHLNAATAPGTWALIDADAGTGELNSMGTDAIKNGIIYRPAAVSPVGQTAVLNSVAFVNGGDPAPRNRPTLTQAFQENASGQSFIASVHHLKSKGSACSAPDAGDGQGNCNQVRLNAVNELLAWLDTDPTGTGDPDILILGDLNSYAREDPIRALEDAGYTNLVPWALGDHAYSFVFDGQWGALDHALASYPFLSQVTGVSEWHINSDEPNVLDYNTNFKSAGQVASLYAPDEFRSSDHDAVVIGLQLEAPAGRLTGSGTFADGSFNISVQYHRSRPELLGSSIITLDGQTLTSTGYKWLVVDGSRATFEGVGTLDESAGYGFFVSATDAGSPGVGRDRIRVKIWELGGAVVYDSQPGDHISAAPTSLLTGGNLTVRSQ
jgi:predicted extracellular nuclease